MEYYAHSLEGKPPEEWQPLEDHLRNVAEMAGRFASVFRGEQWAYLAGLWHDLGKYSNEFQKKLYDANGLECHLETLPGKVVHSQAGGHLAQIKGWKGIDRILCWLIMGHHAGLADYSSADSGGKALEPKMRHPESSNNILDSVPQWLKSRTKPEPPEPLLHHADLSFFIRMLFSCVVDADFLDTESFMDSDKAVLRKQKYSSINDLLSCFDAYMDVLSSNSEDTLVNKIRADVLAQTRATADNEPSVYSLTVPTGGGKTLASMAFALRHAVNFGKRRIIYVIPYTSIIEQTVSVFRSIPGFESSVIEHHSNIQHDESDETIWSRLVSENWDAPIIVTTSVQFFESLYSARTSSCRKLHNISNSVVIFDEAQCLPPDFLRPVTFAVRELYRHYRVTPILCTATQPVLTQTESFDFKFKEGFDSVVEIIKDPSGLFKKLNRVNVKVFQDIQPVTYEKIAEAVLAEKQSALCIVNRKEPDCRILAQLLPEKQTLYLSTNLCGEHRSRVLGEIRSRLQYDPNPLFVVSTSLVEAGVDVDFPVVYRALAGLDSIAQAAGRCNREGRLKVLGKTVVFLPEQQPAYVQSVASIARDYIREDRLDRILMPKTFFRYFKQRFFQLGSELLDSQGVLDLLSPNLEFAFRTASEKFRLINDTWQIPVVVPYGSALELVDRLIERDWESRYLLRALQRYTITIPKPVYWKLMDEEHVHTLEKYPGICILHNHALYSENYGFITPENVNAYEPETTIV